MLHITKKHIGDHLTVILQGRLDRNAAPELEEKLLKSLDGVNKLTFDFSELEYISSAGLRVLLAAQKIMKKDNAVVIKGASTEIKDIFNVTGFSKILTISWI
ncbi:STAS domain-containing protein [Butyrivibrio sp. AE2032]|jgi:anti-sigma B factor antagonist|uniref:STAS domain-containing protein n=1 Tax=Butyrivibrio sp. AE2032 TaxID=1458463 RepID=UPI00068AB120|nr:STAS domain-containing protein [Butyrivibrio sp. AE2032]